MTLNKLVRRRLPVDQKETGKRKEKRILLVTTLFMEIQTVSRNQSTTVYHSINSQADGLKDRVETVND